MVLPRSSRVSRAPPYSWIVFVLPVRGYHPLRPSFPERSSYINTITGLVRVRSPLLTESQLMSFPPGTEMFQFSGFAPSRVTLQCRVSPFGNLRIKGCLHLPTAYRSMPRPSSPLVAKASIRCSYQDTCLKRSSAHAPRFNHEDLSTSKTRDVIHRSGPRLPLDQKPTLAVAQARSQSRKTDVSRPQRCLFSQSPKAPCELTSFFITTLSLCE